MRVLLGSLTVLATAMWFLIPVAFICQCTKKLRRLNPMMADRERMIPMILLNIITLGLYSIYLSYKISDEVYEVGLSYNVKTKLRGWLGLLIAAAGCGLRYVTAVAAKVIEASEAEKAKEAKWAAAKSFIQGIVSGDKGDVAEEVVNGPSEVMTQVVTVLKNVSPYLPIIAFGILLALLAMDMRKIMNGVARNPVAVMKTQMQYGAAKQVAKAAMNGNGLNMKGRVIGARIARQTAKEAADQVVCDAQSMITSDTQINHTAALNDLATEMNNGPVKGLPGE